MAPPTDDELLSLRTAASPALSPDGSQVLFSLTSTDWEADALVPQLWLVPADGSAAPRPVTTDPKGATSGAWSPDGAYISYLAARGDGAKPQIFALPVAGGEPVCLSAADRGVTGYRWSPDGSTIAFLALEPETDERAERKETFGDFVLFRDAADQEHTHVWTLSTAAALPGAAGSGEPQPGVQRTSGKDFTASAGFGSTPLRWAPDSSRLAFVGTANPDLTAGNTATVYVLSDLSGDGEGAVTPLIEQPGPDGSPLWSPCGQFIAYTSQLGRTANALNSVVCVLPAVGAATSGAEPVQLTASFDEMPSPVSWTDAGIYFMALQRTAAHLFCCRVDLRDLLTAPTIDRISGPDGAILNAFDISGARVAAVASSATALPEVVVSELEHWSPRTVTTMSAQIASWDPLGTREVIVWESEDGTEIEGIRETATL